MTNWEWPQWVMAVWVLAMIWFINYWICAERAGFWPITRIMIWILGIPLIALYFGGFWK